MPLASAITGRVLNVGRLQHQVARLGKSSRF